MITSHHPKIIDHTAQTGDSFQLRRLVITHLELKFFGSFQASRNGLPITGFISNKVRALLAFLAVESDYSHNRESLYAMFWPEKNHQCAQANLRNALSNLRKIVKQDSIESPLLSIDRECIQFHPENGCAVDVLEFDLMIKSIQWMDVRHAKGVGYLTHSSDEMDVLIRIAALYQGVFLEGFSLPDSPGFDEWQTIKREQLNRFAMRALHSLVEGLAMRGEYARALGYAQRQVELEPWMEEAHQQLMRLMILDGQRSAALHQFEICKKLLWEGLGVEPGDATKYLYQQIKAGKIASSNRLPGYLTGGSGVTDKKLCFVARKNEISSLARALNLAISGKGQVRLITGSAGQGKTSLALEFICQSLSVHKNLVAVMGTCNSYFGQGDPYQPFREVLEMLSGNVETAWSTGRLDAEGSSRCWFLTPTTAKAIVEKGPALINFLVDGSGLMGRTRQVVISDYEWMFNLSTLVDEKNRRELPIAEEEGLFYQYFNVLHQVSNSVPLLIFLDDLQWADASSLSLFFNLGKRINASHIFLIGAFRSESMGSKDIMVSHLASRHPMMPIINEFQLLFGNLIIDLDSAEDPEMVNEYLDLESNHLDTVFRETLFQRTRGHPLFTIEILLGMKERWELKKDDEGYWVASPSLDWNQSSPRIEAVIRERIQIIPPEIRDLLEVASIEGVRFSIEALAEIKQLEPHQVLRIIRSEMDHPSALLLPDGRHTQDDQFLTYLRFKHHLFQQFIYSQIENPYRNYLHGRYAEVLEKQYAQTRDVAVHLLAPHYQEAGHTRKAAECYYLAGINAERVAANSVAEESYQSALALIPMDDWIFRYTILIALEQLYHRTGQRGMQENVLVELSGIVKNLDLAYQMQVKLLDADYALARWDHKALFENASTVISWARERIDSQTVNKSRLDEEFNLPGYDPLYTGNPDPKRLEVQGLVLLGSYYSGIFYSDDETSKPRSGLSRPIMKEALGLAQTRKFADLEMEIWRALSLESLNQDINEAEQASRRALDIARTIEDRYHESRILNALGLALSRKNAYIEGFECHIQAKNLCKEIGNRFDEGWAIHHLAQFYQMFGRLDLLLDDLLEMHHYAVDLRNVYMQSWSGFVIAHHYYLVGEMINAMEFAERTLFLVRENKFVGQPLETTLAMNGGIHEKLGNLRLAEEYFRESERMIKAGEMKDFLHIPLAGLARLALQEDRFEDALSLVFEFLPLLQRLKILDNGMIIHSYLTAFDILNACGNDCAVSVLEEAVEKVNATAQMIKDDRWRQSFLECNQYNREAINEWNKIHSKC